MNRSKQDAVREDARIAIVGMGCLFPGAQNLTDFWRALRRGEDGITDVPPSHWPVEDYYDADPKAPDRTYCRRGGFLSPVPFDPTEFGIPPAILEATDTSQLLGLMVAKAALEDAGYGDGREFNRERVSVILGVTGLQELALPLSARLGHPIWRRALREAGVDPQTAEQVVAKIAEQYVGWQENSFPGLLGNVIAGRIANRLNLRGTNCVVDAACASSLSAVHLATLELATGRCDMALAGGVDTINDIFMYMCFSKTTALSESGDARPFSAEADGTVLGEGIGIFVLKRLADARRDGDRIYALIAGMGTSSDGRSQSIYAPHSAGQARAMRNAYRLAGCGPETIELIEAHGTGTKVGDVVEFEALKAVFREAQSDGTWCALGSVKSQIGHTKAAAGAAGLMKAALAIYHRSLPPTIKITQPNPKLGVEESPFYLSTELRPWLSRDGHPRRAGVSSFGFGGSNFHAVIEEHQATLPEAAWDDSTQIVALSADSAGGLAESLAEWSAFATGERFDQSWLAYKAAESRRAFPPQHEHRLVVTVEHGVDLAKLLAAASAKLAASVGERAWRLPNVCYGSGRPAGGVVFLFPGQGSQYVGMGRELACTFHEMLAAVQEAETAIQDGGEQLGELIYPPPTFSEAKRERHAAAITRTDAAQPAIGAVSLGMARVLERFGVRPDMTAGHSYGELAALCAAGRFDADTLHRLSRLRGRLMAEGDGDRGTMLAVQAPLAELAAVIEERRIDVVLANRNAPNQGVLSGARDAVARAFEACKERGYTAKPLRVSGAFHSRLMEAAVGPFRQALEAVAFDAGGIPAYANTTGETYPADAGKARDVLARQLVMPVDFVGEIERIYAAGGRTFVEVGPKAVLTGLVGAILGDRPHSAIAVDASAGRRSAATDLARVLGLLAAEGRSVDLARWERSVAEPRKPKMIVPLTGANYRTVGAREDSRTSGLVREGILAPAVSRDREKETLPFGSRLNVVAGSLPSLAAEPGGAEQGTAMPFGSRLDVADALRMVQDGLRAMQQLQQQTAEAHQRFLAGQEQAHRAIQQLMEGQQRVLGQDAGLPIAMQPVVDTAVPAPAAVPPAQPRPAEPVVAESLFEKRESDQSRDREGEALPFGSRLNVVAKPRGPERGVPAQRERIDLQALETTVLEVVCEKTGYPREMVDLDMDIEADLGVDSIKRVEIIAGIEERMPQWKGVKPEYMGSIRTLREIIAFMEPEAHGLPSVGFGDRPAPSAGGGDAGIAEKGLAQAFLAVVSERTGYPQEMLNLDMDMEADLGIDSIKRVEILAALEARVPGLPPVKPEYMGGLRTLRQIMEYFCGEASGNHGRDARATEVRPTDVRATGPAEQACAPSKLSRRVLRCVELPPGEPGEVPIAAGREVWVTDDGTSLGSAIAARLASAGHAVRVVDLHSPQKLDRTAAVGGLIVVAPAGESADPPGDGNSDRLLKAAFALTQRAASGLKAAAAEGGAIFAVVSRMDGAFGLRGGRFDPGQGGLAGLAKTAAKEWPQVRCRAFDVSLDWADVEAIAAAVVGELAADGPIEVGLDADGRRGLELVEDAELPGPAVLAEGDVVVITGGARGVTAEAASALAREFRPTLVLLGRSPAPVEEPRWLADLADEAQIRQAVLTNEFAGQDRPSPMELTAACHRHMANREMRRTLDRIAATGARAVYRSVDVRDAQAVKAVSSDIEAALGPIHGIIHGAGVIEDRLIEDKTPEQFAAVFDTKVAGLRNLLGAVRLDELKCLALFSSVSGRLGNKGQVDYSMANEVLNKSAQRLAAALPSCRVVSINWGPWDGGMVAASLKREFRRQGIELIPLEAGARSLVDELRRSGDGAVEVVIGASLPEAGPSNVDRAIPVAAPTEGAALNTCLALAFNRRLDLERHPFLRSHVLGGRPVLPVAMTMEWLGHAALHANPGLLLHGFDNLRVLHGVILHDGPVTLEWWTGKPRRDGRLFDVNVELRSDGRAGLLPNRGSSGGSPSRSEVVVHVRATAVLATAPPIAPAPEPAEGLDSLIYPRTTEQAYRDILFHGAHFRGIEEVVGYSAHGIVARLKSSSPPQEWMTDPLRSNWLADPLVLDSIFQMSILWCFEELGGVALPTAIGRYRQYRSVFPEDGVTAVLTVRRRSQHQMVCDVDLLDAEGVPVARLEDYECTADASLREAFQRRSVAGVVS